MAACPHPIRGDAMPSPLARRLLGFTLALVAGVAPAAAQESPKKSDEKKDGPVQLTAQEDHKRMMELLKIKELRRGANGNNAKAENAANYDESKANPYP